MEYKKLYTKEEIKDLLQWFGERFDRLPESIRIDQATRVVGMPDTARRLCEMVEANWENPTFSAGIRQVFLLRERLVDECGL